MYPITGPALLSSLLVASVSGSASYPAKPTDLTTPVQQRIAINGPNCKSIRATRRPWGWVPRLRSPSVANRCTPSQPLPWVGIPTSS